MSGYNDIIDEAQALVEKTRLHTLNDRDAMKLDSLLQLLRPNTQKVEAASIFGHKTHKPYVELRLAGKAVTQWSPEQARQHARDVLEAAEASEQDAFMVAYAVEKIGTDERGAMVLLQEFRAFRAAQREKE